MQPFAAPVHPPEIALREKFDRKAFNDFVLSQGLLPPSLLEKAVMQDFVGRSAS